MSQSQGVAPAEDDTSALRVAVSDVPAIAPCPSGGIGSSVDVDDTDVEIAEYLVRRLGNEARDYIRRFVLRLVEAGRTDKANAWRAIDIAAAAAAEPCYLESSDAANVGRTAADRKPVVRAGDPAEALQKAAQCRRLATAITNVDDVTRTRLLQLAAEFEGKAEGAAADQKETSLSLRGAPPRER